MGLISPTVRLLKVKYLSQDVLRLPFSAKHLQTDFFHLRRDERFSDRAQLVKKKDRLGNILLDGKH